MKKLLSLVLAFILLCSFVIASESSLNKDQLQNIVNNLDSDSLLFVINISLTKLLINTISGNNAMVDKIVQQVNGIINITIKSDDKNFMFDIAKNKSKLSQADLDKKYKQLDYTEYLRNYNNYKNEKFKLEGKKQ